MNFSDETIRGDVKLGGAKIEALDCYGASFVDPVVTSLDLDSAIISGPFHAYFTKIDGCLDLTNTAIGILRDTRASWPPVARLFGARYEKLEGDEDALGSSRAALSTRLEWLKLDDRYHPQKYTALATAYENVGQEDLAKRVSIARERERRVSGTSGITRIGASIWSATLQSGPVRSCAPFPVAGLPDAKAFTTTGLASWLSFFLALAGWFLAAVVVAALAGVLRRS